MQEWIEHSLATLRSRWPDLVHVAEGNWIIIKNYLLPIGWGRQSAEIAFQIPAGFPGERPYAFWVRDGLRLANGDKPSNSEYSSDVPRDGQWLKFSWELENWQPGSVPGEGMGMLHFAHSFKHRLAEIN
jgi:hypothetical protein